MIEVILIEKFLFKNRIKNFNQSVNKQYKGNQLQSHSDIRKSLFNKLSQKS